MKWNFINKAKVIFNQDKLTKKINNCRQLLEDINQYTEYGTTKYFLGCDINSKQFLTKKNKNYDINDLNNSIALFNSDFITKNNKVVKNRFGTCGQIIDSEIYIKQKAFYKIRQKLIKWLQ